MASQYLNDTQGALGDSEKDLQARRSIMMAYETFRQHLESGAGLGKNEDGEEFVEIEEAWNEETHATHSVNENDLIDAGIRERHIDSTKDRQSVDDDDDDIDPVEEDEDNGEEIEFELLMQDMETVKLGEEDTSSAGVKQQQLKKIAPTGLRKGFLLQPPSAKESTTNAPSILVKSSNQDKSVPLKGTVVERMTETSTVPEQGSQSSGETKDEDTETLRKTQKHVSRFKQNRMLSRGPL